MQPIFNLRKASFTVLALCLAALSWPQDAKAQTIDDALRFSHRNPATGARMLGMSGGGGMAGMADYTAFLYNPAGLGLFDKSMVAGALNTLSALDQSTFNVGGIGEESETDVRHTGLANFAYLYRFPTTQGSLVIGAAYNEVNSFERELSYSGENPNNSISHFFLPTPQEYFVETDGDGNLVPGFRSDIPEIAYNTFGIDFDPALYDGGAAVPFWAAAEAGPLLQSERVTETGAMREVNIGGAAEAARGLLVGLSANLNFGQYNFRRVFEEVDIDNANDGSGITTDFAALAFSQGLESELVGFNLRGGISSELASDLRLGLMLESPTYYNISENFNTVLETEFDNGDFFTSVEEVPDLGNYEFEYQLLTPWRLGLGFNYAPGAFSLGGDLEFVDWTQMRFHASTDEAYFDDLNTDIRDRLNAVVNARLGGEYWLGAFGLRAGVAYQPDPVERDSDDTVDHSRSFLSAGFGWRAGENLQVDFGWSQERFEDRYQPYSISDAQLDNLDIPGPTPVVLEDIVRNRFAVGVRVLF